MSLRCLFTATSTDDVPVAPPRSIDMRRLFLDSASEESCSIFRYDQRCTWS